MGMVAKRFDVWLINLNPTTGSEIAKTRPCVIVSPDEMNDYLNTAIICPLTSTIKNYPFRLRCTFEGKSGQLATDQIRSVDKVRLVKRLGKLDSKTSGNLLEMLADIFEF